MDQAVSFSSRYVYPAQTHVLPETKPEWKCVMCKKRHCFICPSEIELCSHLRTIEELERQTKAQKKQAAIHAFAFSKKRQETQRKAEAAKATKATVARTTKKCPKAGCGNMIERKGGCSHFRCPEGKPPNVCNTHFCWECKVIRPGGAAIHLTTCSSQSLNKKKKEDLDTTGYAADWDKDPGYDFALDADLKHYS
jgi:hypothetical protein